MSDILYPPIRVQLVDEKGFLREEWRRFFDLLWTRVGAATALTNLELAALATRAVPMFMDEAGADGIDGEPGAPGEKGDAGPPGQTGFSFDGEDGMDGTMGGAYFPANGGFLNGILQTGSDILTGSTCIGYLANSDLSVISGVNVPNYGIAFAKMHSYMTGPGLTLGGFYGIVMHANGAERMRITDAGFVGVGTSQPNTRLDVSGPAKDQIRVRVDGDATNYFKIGRSDIDGSLSFYGTQSGSNGFYFGGAGSSGVNFSPAGKVGIGMTPTNMLDVNGALGATTVTATGAFGCNGSVAQSAMASGGSVASTAATNVAPYGYTTAAQANAIITLLNNIRSALVNNGIMS